jgi:ubiquinol-cytochrome c reductase cytochrome b subunit
MRFRPLARIALFLWTLSFFVLLYCGAKPPEGVYVWLARLGTAYYFAYFLVILPLLGRLERTLPLPESISRPVLRGGGPLPAGAAAKPMEKA